MNCPNCNSEIEILTDKSFYCHTCNKIFEYKSVNYDYLLNIVETCKDVKQDEKYHPEGDVLTHLLQTFNTAYKESKDYDLVLSALLHDVGKQITRLRHDKESVKLIEGFVSEKTLWLVKHHMRIWSFISGEMKRYQKVQDYYNHKWFKELIMLARWDKMSINPNVKVEFNRDKLLKQLKGLNEKTN